MKPIKLSVNVSQHVLAQVDALVRDHQPFASRHAIHRAALRVGLAELHAHPERVVEAVRGHDQPEPGPVDGMSS